MCHMGQGAGDFTSLLLNIIQIMGGIRPSGALRVRTMGPPLLPQPLVLPQGPGSSASIKKAITEEKSCAQPLRNQKD